MVTMNFDATTVTPVDIENNMCPETIQHLIQAEQAEQAGLKPTPIKYEQTVGRATRTKPPVQVVEQIETVDENDVVAVARKVWKDAIIARKETDDAMKAAVELAHDNYKTVFAAQKKIKAAEEKALKNALLTPQGKEKIIREIKNTPVQASEEMQKKAPWLFKNK